MKLGDVFRRPADGEEFSELEAGIGTAMMIELAPSSMPTAAQLTYDPDSPAMGKGLEADSPNVEPRISGAAQARFAEFAVFDDMHRGVQSELETLASTLTRVNAAHHQTREFLNIVYAGIHRTNELEGSVTRLSAENRSLFRQAEHVKRLKAQVDSLTEAFKQRETRLLDTAESLREALSAKKLDLAEANVLIGRMEGERQEMMNALATATSHSERAVRENEMLRERTINLAADLESVSRKRTEAERKLDEISAQRERDVDDLTEARSKLMHSETERTRLQKQNDSLNSRLIDATESLNALENEFAEQAQRNDLMLQGLKSERDTLSARLESSLKAEQGAAERIAELTSELDESAYERRVMEEKMAGM